MHLKAVAEGKIRGYKEELNDLFDRQKADSFLLTEEKWDEWRSPWKKFVGWFAHLLAPFL